MSSHGYTQHAEVLVVAGSGRRIRVQCDCVKKLDHRFERPLASRGAAEASESSWHTRLLRIVQDWRAVDGWSTPVSRDPSGSHWMWQFPHALLGPLFWGWFRARTQDQREWRYPTRPSAVSVAGIGPIRILIIGDGPAAGCGVHTHDLGIAGHLARHIAGRLDRGVAVTVMAQPGASARATRKRLHDLDLDGYDTVLLMLATTDAFCLTNRRRWRRDMTELVRALSSTDTSSLFVTSTANLQVARSLSPFGRCLTGLHARMLNIETSQICAQFNTPMIHLDASSDLTSRTYKRWGHRIGAHIVNSLHNSSSATDDVNTGVAFWT